jgi:hypothetical protein
MLSTLELEATMASKSNNRQRSRSKKYLFIACSVLVGSLAFALATTPAASPTQLRTAFAGAEEGSQPTESPVASSTNYVTRGRLAQQVANAAGFHEDPGSQIFEDLPPGSHFYDWVNRLANRGLVSGNPCGTVPDAPCIEPDNRPYFLPDAEATRGQISKVIANAAGFDDAPVGQTFEDVPPGSTFYEFIERLASRDLLTGYECGTAPDEPCIEPDNRPYFRPFDLMTMPDLVMVVNNTFHGN